MMLESYRPFTMLGLVFILVGIGLLLLPLIPKIWPILERLENLPPILIYVYHHDNFYFVTSPLLIVISLALLLWWILKA